MITAIIFDCFGVLTADLWKEFVVSLPSEQQQPARELNHKLDAGELSLSNFAKAIHELTGRSPQSIEDIITSDMPKNKALLEYIATLKETHKIGLLSNISSDWITRVFLSPAEAELFDAMVLSYEIGATKPDRRAYQAVASELGVRPEQCVFIDDSPANCEGAEKAGMQAVVYENLSMLKHNLKSIL